MASSIVDSHLLTGRTSKVVMVVDVVESVRLMELDERSFIERWHNFVRHATNEIFPTHSGQLHKSLGDGLMVVFSDARSAAAAAFSLQHHIRQANASYSQEHRMHVRIALHRADFVRDDFDIYGVGVNLAARLASQAGPTEIVVSSAVRDELTDALDADVEDLGEHFLKHVAEPVRVYRINEPGCARAIPDAPLDLDVRKPTIAVIPFEARSSGEHEFAIGELIADSVIGQLCRSRDLRVISRLSTTAFRARDVAAKEIERHLNANYVVAGSYVVSGGRLLIIAELSDAQGEVLWSERLSGSVGDLLLTESELSQQIAAAAHEAILQKEVSQATTQRLPSLESHSLMLGAITLMHRTTFSDFFQAEKLFNLLIERHPRHAELLAWIAKWHVLRVEQGWSENATLTAKMALSSTARALDIDPNSSLALAVDGFVRCNLLKDLDGAGHRYEAAIDANPNEPLAWLFSGMRHGFTGELDPALKGVETALALSPLDPARYFFLSLAASVNLSAGNHARAIELARLSLKSNSSHASTHRALVIALALDGQVEAARSQASELLQIDSGFTVSRFLARRQGSNFSELGKMLADGLRMAGVPE